MNIPSTDSTPLNVRPAALWEFRIDVGGTFTDCIGVSPNGLWREFKVLSSGLTRGTPESSRHDCLTDSRRRRDPQDFWVGAVCRLRGPDGSLLRECRVAGFDNASGTLQLDHVIADVDSFTYELDCGLPAPVLAIRWLLALRPDATCPPVRLRFGTTRGTNALLTRSGARTALVTTKGFGDVPLIGNQDRPDLFALDIVKPEPLFCRVIEVDERMTTDGTVLRPLTLKRSHSMEADCQPDAGPPSVTACVRTADAPVSSGADLRNQSLATSSNESLTTWLKEQLREVDSVAICLMNAFANPRHEIEIEQRIRELGVEEVSRSSEVSPLIRYVPRCDTTVLDAYLNPVLRAYMNDIRRLLPASEIQVMTSNGGLVNATAFRGRDCVLSGPAGGIVGFSSAATADGFSRAIGFDMGGTSTDVARYEGQFEYQTETVKAGVRIATPVLAIETVAAGGGSICGFDGTRLFVGPQSAGAAPGPACYGAGGPLTVTDLNVFLGRLIPDRFPFPLNVAAVDTKLREVLHQMKVARAVDEQFTLHMLAEGLLEIANDNMSQAIRRVSIARGYHPEEYVLVSFGGAGGQHACSIARRLGIRKILIHPAAGILSAFGMGQADVRVLKQQSVLKPLDQVFSTEVIRIQKQLETQAEREVLVQHPAGSVSLRMSLQLRYIGTDSTISVDAPTDGDFRRQFEQNHQRLFGYIRPNHAIEIAAMTVEAVSAAQSAKHDFGRQTTSGIAEVPEKSTSGSSTRVEPSVRMWWNGTEVNAVVVNRADCRSGDRIHGPAILCESTSTIFIEPGCSAIVSETGSLIIDVPRENQIRGTAAAATTDTATPSDIHADPVLLEVFSNQFASIAEQMGETLRRTSISTNVRERLDFSCAVFNHEGQLIVNAPHVPVHLGAMGATVRALMEDHPQMQPGDVYVTNDPYRGGSHLPDVTVITPVFCRKNSHAAPKSPVNEGELSSTRPDFFVASRAHHAEIGGIAPGSMPPFSRSLSEEGVLIRSRKLVQTLNGHAQFDEDGMRTLLLSAKFPTRAVDDNIADLTAQVAANNVGAGLLMQLSDRHSVTVIQSYMNHVLVASAARMRNCLRQLPDGEHQFRDAMDDGTPICVTVRIRNDEVRIDFTGSGDVSSGNLNANTAIVTAAVLYSLRCLLNEDIPLNAGVLEPVELIIPPGILNPPAGKSPETSPAVVGGNVETSQRIVDVVLAAFGLAAASQGTMNNLTFGDGSFGYYETICGGAGATPKASGADAVHTHMTNTRLTDPEVLERRYPVRLKRFGIRQGSGGDGRHHGGSGIIRQLEFLKPLQVSMLTQRRTRQPFGLNGGEPGMSGQQQKLDDVGSAKDLPGSFSDEFQPGEILSIETPGGGGWGPVQETGTPY